MAKGGAFSLISADADSSTLKFPGHLPMACALRRVCGGSESGGVVANAGGDEEAGE